MICKFLSFVIIVFFSILSYHKIYLFTEYYNIYGELFYNLGYEDHNNVYMNANEQVKILMKILKPSDDIILGPELSIKFNTLQNYLFFLDVHHLATDNEIKLLRISFRDLEKSTRRLLHNEINVFETIKYYMPKILAYYSSKLEISNSLYQYNFVPTEHDKHNDNLLKI